MANIPDPAVGNGHQPKGGAPRRLGFLRWITGSVVLAVGVFLLIASRDKIGDWHLDKIMATYAGVVMLAFGVTLILTHFEAPRRDLDGATSLVWRQSRRLRAGICSRLCCASGQWCRLGFHAQQGEGRARRPERKTEISYRSRRKTPMGEGFFPRSRSGSRMSPHSSRS